MIFVLIHSIKDGPTVRSRDSNDDCTWNDSISVDRLHNTKIGYMYVVALIT